MDELIDMRCIGLMLDEPVKEGIYVENGGVGGIVEEFDVEAGVVKFCGAVKELALKMSAGFT